MPFARLAAAGAVISLLVCASARASFVINPTYDSTITSDVNSSAIKGAIGNAIAAFESNFSDSITINITFGEMSTGLGSSTKTLYNLNYSTFRTALAADAKSSDDASALANSVPVGANNPVTGTPNIFLSTANIKALPTILGSFPSVLSCGATCDGFIQLNTSLTTPGSPSSSNQYTLQTVAEHEIDEVLGLGSSLPTFSTTTPSPEDLFRYGATAHVRSFTASTSATAFFSIDGTTHLAEFNNQVADADFGDWRSNPLPAGAVPEVQDAFATPGASPALGVELRALDVIGYDRVVAPEPATTLLVASALAVLAGLRKISAR